MSNAYREEVRQKLKAFVERLLSAPPANGPTANSQTVESNVTREELHEICLRSREQFMLEPTLLRITPPLFVLGDLHGQFLDLRRFFEHLGAPPRQRYLFLGDYVDRGSCSLETVSILLAMKILYPQHIHMLRGNHETRAVNRKYGFVEECKQRFGEEQGLQLWTDYQHVFNCMPFAALVADRIFCAHGGISENLVSWKQFDRVVRPTDVCEVGPLADVIWSDPSTEVPGYAHSPREISKTFGAKALENFCKTLKVDLVVRAHQCPDKGYETFGDKRCVTIFSAPSYCEGNNDAATLHISKSLECTIYTMKPRKA
ncbi:protein phosphatase [Aphelenchoides avenae]|nr:protein phosphatase [Aphelenchus avenae]